MNTTIGLVDDHQLFLRSLTLMIQSFGGFEVMLEAVNGKDLFLKLKSLPAQPDIMLLDVNMPEMNGIDTARQLREQYPLLKIVALSMNDDDATVIEMFKAGCCAYLLKDTHPTELEKALQQVALQGFYNADRGAIDLRRLLNADEKTIKLTDRERTFLQLACSDKTYKEIASDMHLSVRTIDGYREDLFEKFGVKSRVGLCLEGIRRKLVTV